MKNQKPFIDTMLGRLRTLFQEETRASIPSPVKPERRAGKPFQPKRKRPKAARARERQPGVRTANDLREIQKTLGAAIAAQKIALATLEDVSQWVREQSAQGGKAK